MAKNKKKQLYDIYYSLNNFLMSKLNAKGKDSVSSEELLAKYIGYLWDKEQLDYTASKTECTATVEWSYIKENSPAIFPESLNLLDKLFHSKYLFKDDFNLVFPFNTFQVAIPRGFEIEGQKIPPFIVNIGHLNDLISQKKEFFKVADLDASEDYPDEVIYRNERFIQIAISGGKSNMGQNPYLQIRESMLPIAVKSKNVEEYCEYMQVEHAKDKANGYHENQIEGIANNNWKNPKDSLIEFSILKIIAVLSIYLSATENIFLKKGLPGSHMSSVGMIDKIDRPAPYILKQTDTIKKLSNNSSPEEHYRVFHFRNLKADKYYQGEHSHLKKGSRWVFVKDSLVNSKTKGHTPIKIA